MSDVGARKFRSPPISKPVWVALAVMPLLIITSCLIFGRSRGLVVFGYALLAIAGALAVCMPVHVIAEYRRGKLTTVFGSYVRKTQPVAFTFILLLRLLMPLLLVASMYVGLLDLEDRVV